jgi:hypothetical protein
MGTLKKIESIIDPVLGIVMDTLAPSSRKFQIDSDRWMRLYYFCWWSYTLAMIEGL